MRYIFLLFFAACAFTSNAQDSLKYFRKFVYRANVFVERKVVSDYIVKVTDTTVVLSSTPQPYYFPTADGSRLKHIHYKDIRQIDVKRKGSTGLGFVIGTLVGAGLGACIGFSSGEDGPFPSHKRVMGGSVFFGLTGGMIGLIAGGLSGSTFAILKKRSALKELNTSLLEKMYAK